MSWLWNNMGLEISDICMFLDTAKEVWEFVQETYSKVNDVVQIYEIKMKMLGIKQGTHVVTEYSNYLKGLWQEMNLYQNIQMKCSDDASLLKRFSKKDRIYDFLVGLYMEFAVLVQIL